MNNRFERLIDQSDFVFSHTNSMEGVTQFSHGIKEVSGMNLTELTKSAYGFHSLDDDWLGYRFKDHVIHRNDSGWHYYDASMVPAIYYLVKTGPELLRVNTYDGYTKVLSGDDCWLLYHMDSADNTIITSAEIPGSLSLYSEPYVLIRISTDADMDLINDLINWRVSIDYYTNTIMSIKK